MNKKMVSFMLGKMVQIESALMIPSLVCAFLYGESEIVFSFIITMVIALILGLLLTLLGRTEDKTIFAKEGFVIVSLTWIVMSAVGALPFVISGEIPHFVDAFFEVVSGFTTTGSSILMNVEEMSKGLLFWRSFTHWVGGMGVLVLAMAILPSQTGRTIHIVRAEMPGPVIGKLVPKVRSTAKILYLIYIFISAVQVIFLLAGGMSLFESLVHMFGTAGTGGFGIKSDSIGSYSPYLQWVITVFMLIFGVNFNLYYFILLKKIKVALKSEEFWAYISIFAATTALIAINIFNNVSGILSVSESIRTAAFQVASIVTTTGYATTDFNLWPGFSKMILLILIFIGSCAGSTAGGFKISRVVILFKSVKANLKHSLHSRSVDSVHFEGKTLDNETVLGVKSYLVIYIFCFVAILFLISFNGFDIETNFSAAATCFNNVGPGLGMVGPALNFAEFSGFSKIVLSAAMLLGRLEIYPMLLLFSPYVWKKSKSKG